MEASGPAKPWYSNYPSQPAIFKAYLECFFKCLKVLFFPLKNIYFKPLESYSKCLIYRTRGTANKRGIIYEETIK